jgi:hypothetical protein
MIRRGENSPTRTADDNGLTTSETSDVRLDFWRERPAAFT